MASIKNMMAAKYPAQSKKEGLDPAIVPKPPQPSYSWNNNRVLVISILLGIVFLLVSLPSSYKTTGTFFGLFQDDEFSRVFPFKLSLIHAAIFTVIKIVNTI